VYTTAGTNRRLAYQNKAVIYDLRSKRLAETTRSRSQLTPGISALVIGFIRCCTPVCFRPDGITPVHMVVPGGGRRRMSKWIACRPPRVF